MRPRYSNINIPTGAHKTGTAIILAVPKEWIAEEIIADFETNTITQNIVLSAGKKFIELQFTPESYEFNDDPKDSDSGSFYTTLISGSCNYLSPSISELLEYLRYRELVLVALDKTGNQKIIGNQTKGAILRYSNDNTSDDQNIPVTFNYESEAANFTYTGTTSIANDDEVKTMLKLLSTADYKLQSGAKSRGVCSIKFAPKDWFRDMAEVFNNNVGQFKFKANKNWIGIQFMPRSYHLEQKVKPSASGDFFESTITGALSAISPEVQQILETIRMHEHVVCCQNANGREIFLGNYDHGMILKYGFKQPYNSQEVEIQFYIEHEEPSYSFSETAKNVLTTEDGEILVTEDGVMLEG